MTRSRSTQLINTVKGPFVWKNYTYTGAEVGRMTQYHTHTKSKTITDELTPGYHLKLAQGKFLPINPLTIETVEQDVTSVSAGTVTNGKTGTAYRWWTGQWYTLISAPYPPSFTPSSSDIDAVVIKALAKVKEPDWDVLTFLGELPQTVKLLVKTWKRLATISRRVARKAFKREMRRSRRKKLPYDSKRALNDFTSLWLEARYGWRPLVYDIESMVKALNHKRSSGIQRRGAMLIGDCNSSPTPITYNSNSVAYIVTKVRTGTVTYRAKVYHQSDMGPVGFNPVITAWELTRFSFVVDWFVNIGSWLTAITPRVGYNQLGISVSWKAAYTETDTTVQSPGTVAPGGWSVAVSPQVLTRTVEKYVRYEYTGIPLPSIQVKLNSFKIIDLIALALQSQRDVAKILRL